jgi:deoxyguanosine kinase
MTRQRGRRAFVALGSNLGDREGQMRRALEGLSTTAGVEVVQVSPVYENAAQTLDPDVCQPGFLNAVAEVRTVLAPETLLAALHAIEHAQGRERRERWSPRPIDLDLILYEDVHTPADAVPALPHPRLAERRFVLRPLADIAPDAVVPGFETTAAGLLARCPDPHSLERTTLTLMTEPNALPESLRYLAVEGVIGAGKTSLARMLAARMEARLVLEEFDENPFLPHFYDDARRWAFHTQLAFLASRFRQQKDLLSPDLFRQRTVSDYTFDKDRVFAHVTLEGDELSLYETVFTLMEPATATPDLIVYLRSSVDRLMHNIERRGRSYERDMQRQYIAEVAGAYDQYFLNYSRSPLLVVDSTAIDFVNHPGDFERLVGKIASCVGTTGRSMFNPPPSLELDFS